MYTAAFVAGALALIGLVISRVPQAIKEIVIIITALVGIVLLLPVPAMIVAIMFRLEGLEAWLNEFSFFKMMASGIAIVCVTALFYQEWIKDIYPDGIPDD